MEKRKGRGSFYPLGDAVVRGGIARMQYYIDLGISVLAVFQLTIHLKEAEFNEQFTEISCLNDAYSVAPRKFQCNILFDFGN